jgi:hypothetical protein
MPPVFLPERLHRRLPVFQQVFLLHRMRFRRLPVFLPEQLHRRLPVFQQVFLPIRRQWKVRMRRLPMLQDWKEP